jgi:hypothetical protein
VFPRSLGRWFRMLALAMMVVGALFGIPIVIDPPPRDASAECQEREAALRPKRRRARAP